MKRQVVLIMTDTQGANVLGCYGHSGLHTPRLDRLAAGGLRFERAYTCQPVCGPARAALFTGQFPHTVGSWANGMPLGQGTLTLGQRAREAGVHTAYIGKWHLDGGDYFGAGRCPEGWDPAYWYDMRNYLEELPEADRVISRRVATNRIPGGVRREFTFGHRCSNRAMDFLARYRDEEFLLVLSYDEPHGPYLCPEPYASMFREYVYPARRNLADTLADKPEHHRVWAGPRLTADRKSLKIQKADYFGCNAFVDDEIGRVLDAIERVTPEALVIFTSDHGDMLESHALTNKGPAAYEEIANIPLLVRWPGQTQAGAVCRHPVSHIDIVPTLLDYLGQPAPGMLEGRSLLSCFRDPHLRVNEAVFIEFGRYETDHDGFGGFQPLRAVCDGRHKLVVNLLSSDELYDLVADPDELTNRLLDPAYRSIRDRLHDRLLDWMNRTRDPFRGYHWERRPWRADARPATWSHTGMTRQRVVEPGERQQLDYDTGLEIKETTRRK
jgi:uncharacterized sulfatase